jgi:hypothetical protein
MRGVVTPHQGKGKIMLRLALLVIVAMFSVMGLSPPAVALQSGTPAPGAQACAEIEPRDLASLQTLPGTPDDAATANGQADTSATPTPFAMPDGEAADQAVVDEITSLYEQLIACLNAGDYLRAYALYTDDYLLRNLSAEAIDTLVATPVPVEESQQSEFGGVLDTRLQDDDRIAALITTSNPHSGEVLIFSLLRREDDRLLIDDEQVVEAEVPPATPGSTPAP